MCNCGCNTCETKGPLLTEGKVKSLLSEGLQYHIDKKIPLFETVYRIGSDKHLALIKESRKMYSRNIIDLCEEDEALIGTHLGEFALYEQTSTVSKRRAGAELKQKLKGVRSDGFGKYDATIYGLDSDGKRVELKSLNDLNKFDKFELAESESIPLDLPMLNEFSLPKFDVVKPIIDKFLGGIEKAGKKLLNLVKREGKQTLALVKEIAEYVIKGEKPNASEQKKITKQLLDLGAIAAFGISGGIPVSAFSIMYWVIQESGMAKEFFKLDEDANGTYMLRVTNAMRNTGKGQESDNVPPFFMKHMKDAGNLKEKLKGYKLKESKEDLDEAEFKGKKVSLGKPKRGGPKAYYVYVKDGDKVKKVTFGSGGLRAKIKNKEARNAFAARHNCKDKKDRTKAGYWSCNLPRYAPALGLGAKMNTFW